MANISLFAQILRYLPKEKVATLVKKHNSDKFSKGFNSWSHLVSMIFCQFAGCSSLREISNGLKSATGNLNHLGFNRAPSKSTLSYQNEHRSSELFRDCYYMLLDHLGQQAGFSRRKFRIKNPIKLLDSTVIILCMSIYDWAHYTKVKGAVKLHTMLDFHTLLPEYVYISDGKGADNTVAHRVPLQKNSIVVADRIYCDFGLLNLWDSSDVFYVVRHKHRFCFETIEELELPKKRHQNILKDEIIMLTNSKTKKKYTKPLRRIAVYNEKDKFTVELLTNNMDLAASTIADLYKSRWEIEIFFRNIKQNFSIKSFVGTSRNAVEIQLWSALITMLILSFLKQIAGYKWILSNLIASLRLNTFTKIDLQKWLDEPFTPPPETTEIT